MQRCNWPNLNNSQTYLDYHDNEWGEACYDDHHLFEMFILESFHCGLSWLLVLKKRAEFRAAFDNFDAEKMALYDQEKIDQLLDNEGIIRNKAKILAAISNAKAYLKVKAEFGSFSNYLWGFTDHKVLYFPFDGQTTHNDLSDKIAYDLKKRGFKFMGTVTCFSYLEAIGIMNNHAVDCFKYKPLDQR